MQILTTAVIKGGTGKTTTAAAIAQAAAADRKKVLAIDLDPQANFTYAIGANQNAPGSYDLLHGADPHIQKTAQGISVIAASPDLATEKTTGGSAKRLQRAIGPLKSAFDFIVIDTPPTIGELTYNALQAATGLIIPLEADSNSIQGLYTIVDIAERMQQSNPDLSIIGVVLTRFDPRPKINRYLRDVIADKGKEVGAPLLATIRSGVAIREAQAMQQSLFEYAPKSKPAQDYEDLYKKLKRKR